VLSLFELGALLLVLTALFGWLNHVVLHLPHTIGLLLMGLCASLALVGLELVVPSKTFYEDLASPVEGGPISGHLHAIRRRLQSPTIQRRTWL